jgi:hypothetical protein
LDTANSILKAPIPEKRATFLFEINQNTLPSDQQIEMLDEIVRGREPPLNKLRPTAKATAIIEPAFDTSYDDNQEWTYEE